MAELPLILAGPIVRRVELTSASFWIATSKAGAKIKARVFDLASNQVGEAEATARAFGEKLHVTVVSVPCTLAPGQIYSYDIFVDGTNLKAAGLLEDKPASGDFPGQVALGYQKDLLPTFVTPAGAIQDLRLAHASCRKTNGPGYDAMGWLDDYIAENRNQPLKRPQQLFLTGDQIYADEVAPCMLPMLNAIGRDLLKSTKYEYIPLDADTHCECSITHLPAMRRQQLVREKGGFTSSAAHNHLIGFGEYAAMYLAVWSPHVWRKMATLDELYVPVSATSPAMSWLTQWENCDEKNKTLQRWREKTQEETQEEIKRAELFRATVPKAARALANAATYMQFDDHEVTDDWNLNKSWSNRVYSRHLGNAIVRNALMAETIFQAWGNDPAAFTQGNNKELLDNASLVATAPEPGLAPAEVNNKLKTLMGASGESADKQAKWHFTVTGPRHIVAVTDTRTHRKFAGNTVQPPSLLGDNPGSQIPASLPQGMELLIVVSPVPVLSPTLFETIAQPIIMGVRDAVNWQRKKAIQDPCHPGGPVWGHEDYDAEGWGANEEALEKLLLHLANHGKAVILSGDVHYSNSLELDLWKKGAAKPSRIVQLTCSSARNDMKPVLQALARDNASLQEFQRGLAAERLGWHSGDLTLTFPNGKDGKPPKVAIGRLARAKRSPALLPTRGWPAGTKANKEIDWRWRMRMARDQRPNNDAGIPPEHRQPGLTPPGDVNPPADPIGSYAKVVSRQVITAADHFDHLRQMVFNTNVGLVSFSGSGDNLKVIHTLLSHNGVKDENKGAPATVHEVRLVTPPAEVPPDFPPAQP
jgi:hypothetical protein